MCSVHVVHCHMLNVCNAHCGNVCYLFGKYVLLVVQMCVTLCAKLVLLYVQNLQSDQTALPSQRSVFVVILVE